MSITIGIVGFGVVGQSALKFFVAHAEELRSFLGLDEEADICLSVWDKNPFTPEQEVLLEKYEAAGMSSEDCSLEMFLNYTDHVLVSPGVDLTSVAAVAETFCELDLFAFCFTGKTIGITGSLGKTTVTKLIYQLLVRFYEQHGMEQRIALGGNVGIGMLDLLHEDEQSDWAVLELSSFQLERSATFIPDIGVWTNLYPNHLDRHGDMAGYFEAKAKLFGTAADPGSESGMTVLGTQLLDPNNLAHTLNLIAQTQGRLVIAGASMPSDEIIAQVARSTWELWVVQDGFVTKCAVQQGVIIERWSLIAVQNIPLCTFIQNWALIFATLDVAGVDMKWLAQDLQDNPDAYQPDDHRHRMEFVQQCNGVDFYNDSKSTVKESTVAAVQQLAGVYKRMHVIIGGLGKGVDRTDFTLLLSKLPEVVTIVAFGKEAGQLGATQCVSTLEEAVQQVMVHAQPGDVVLLSPGGTSYDLFKHYEHRGDRFKEIVAGL